MTEWNPADGLSPFSADKGTLSQILHWLRAYIVPEKDPAQQLHWPGSHCLMSAYVSYTILFLTTADFLYLTICFLC